MTRTSRGAGSCMPCWSLFRLTVMVRLEQYSISPFMRGTWLSSQRALEQGGVSGCGKEIFTRSLSVLRLFAIFATAKLSCSFVPCFDQPSQVFFPKKLAGVVGALDPKLEDDDVVRVRKLFEVIAKVTTEQGINSKRSSWTTQPRTSGVTSRVSN